MQAGELRKEKGANATILIGEYDEEFFCGRIKAYSWFMEGWAPYPIIWHGGKKEDEFPFALRLPEDNGLSREAVKAKSANKEYLDRMPESIIKDLLPEMQIGRDSISCSLGNYLAQIWNTDTPHLIINADGGMGKTTMLLNECQGKEKVVLYIPVEKLVAMQIGVREYITRVLFIGNNDYFAEFAGIKYRQPSLTLMVDGLNEVDGMAERRIINEIEGINLFQGIQTVITSRSDFTSRHLMSGYRNARLIPLNEDQIKSVFSKDELDVIKTTTTLYKLLTNPMMITMYKQVSPIIQKYRTNECFDWIVPMKNASDLLHNYYVAQIAIMFDRFGTSGEHIMQAQQIVFGVLPALGYAYETGHRINMRREEFRALLQKVVCDFVVNKKKLLPIQEHFRHYSTPELNFGIAIDILIHEMCLIYSDDSFVSFPHQINRDYLSANWIVQVTERDDGKEQIDAIWNERSLPYPVMEHIWHTGDGKRKRILRTKAGNYIMIVHPNLSVIANSNGRRLLETHNYYEKDADGGKRGWWYDNLYSVKDPAIEGDILDLAFNTYRHELAAILNNGKIVFCHEKYCRYHSSTEIITSFNTAAYDFRGCVCDERIREKLRQNGANVDE